MAAVDKKTVIATGATTNQTSAAVELETIVQVGAVAAQLVVEAVGATPAITWKMQGSLDNVNWYDIAYYTDASDTVAVTTRTGPTAAGAQVNFLDLASGSRYYKYFRAVTSAITNTTYRVELYVFTLPR